MITLPLLALTVYAAAVLENDPPPGRRGGDAPRGGGAGAAVQPAEIPPDPLTVLVTRPQQDRATLSLLATRSGQASVRVRAPGEADDLATASIHLTAGTPAALDLTGLRPATEQEWLLTLRPDDGIGTLERQGRLVTQRRAGQPFTFAVQADSHLDVSTDTDVYRQTLANIARDRPDFLIDLGDTTMVDKFRADFRQAAGQYVAQRHYLAIPGRESAVYLVLGNHDGEKGERLDGTATSMPVWAAGMRKTHFPNPEPGGIYSGNATPEPFVGLPQNYYAWTWGDALFVVLDPFRPTRQRGGDDMWHMTLGREQYDWLERTLRESTAAFRFVFIHHLVGGLGRDTRGGAGCAPYMEWGGRDAEGRDVFAERRPGWPMPIHDLLRKHRVDVVFHGHDHLYAREELDGIVYQEVPQPGHPAGGTRSAIPYGYGGVVLGSSGHLRVRVEAGGATVEYIRCAVAGHTRGDEPNGAVVHRYTRPPAAR